VELADLVHAGQIMKRLLKEPLLHFLLLGALLFVAYGLLSRRDEPRDGRIAVTRGQLENLQVSFSRVWQRPPTPQELQGLVETWIREEVLYREGLAMGLDRDDPLVRRRIAQKMDFIAAGQGVIAPTEAELQAWLDARPDDYRVEPKYSLRQIYLNPSRRGGRLEAAVAAALAALGRGAVVEGDSTLLPDTLDDATESEVAWTFGSGFAQALATQPVGGWWGPVRSEYGVHLVELRASDAGRVPALAEVRPAVARDLLAARARDANEAFYRKLRVRYTVRVEEWAASANREVNSVASVR
jgi:hypothetical protein